MKREDLVKEVAKKTGLTAKSSAQILETTLEVIEKAVSKGKKVVLVGFGSFEARKRSARTGRNPQTGASIKIPAKTVPVFTAGKKFKSLMKK